MIQDTISPFISHFYRSSVEADREAVSWRVVCEFLEGLETEKTAQGFFTRALDQFERSLGFDHGMVGVSRKNDFQNPRVFIPRNSPPGFWESYLGHFMPLDPIVQNLLSLPTAFSLDTKALGDNEFGHDFSAAMGNRFGADLCSYSEAEDVGFVFVMYREGRQPFNSKELALLKALYPHLRNLSIPLIAPESTRKKRLDSLFSEMSLSAREGGIAALLLDRLSVEEIATRLFISPRTVEKHLQHLYAKLGLDGKNAVQNRMLELAESLNPSGWNTRAMKPQRDAERLS